MDALTLDQIQIFLAVVDEGSFSKAAKKLNRAQSAVTYGIQKLEAQIGLPLFDRTAYRPTLTEAGRTLLLRARRIAEETNAFRDTARSLASGLEAELTIVLDSMFPMPPVVEALRAFTDGSRPFRRASTSSPSARRGTGARGHLHDRIAPAHLQRYGWVSSVSHC